MFKDAAPTAVVISSPRPSSSMKPEATEVSRSLASSRGPLTVPPIAPTVSEISTSPTTIVAPPVVKVQLDRQ